MKLSDMTNRELALLHVKFEIYSNSNFEIEGCAAGQQRTVQV